MTVVHMTIDSDLDLRKVKKTARQYGLGMTFDAGSRRLSVEGSGVQVELFMSDLSDQIKEHHVSDTS